MTLLPEAVNGSADPDEAIASISECDSRSGQNLRLLGRASKPKRCGETDSIYRKVIYPHCEIAAYRSHLHFRRPECICYSRRTISDLLPNGTKTHDDSAGATWSTRTRVSLWIIWTLTPTKDLNALVLTQSASGTKLPESRL